MGDRIYFGKHWVRLINDDTLFFKFIGPIDKKDAQESTDLVRRFMANGKSFFVVSDLSELGAMEPEARRMASRWFSENNIAASNVFGSKWTTRAIAEMVIALLRVMGRLSFPISFSRTESEAMAWIEEQRRLRA